MTLVQKNAPDFTADAVVGGDFKTIKLSDYRGKWVCLFFYPLDFTFVCPTEITAFSDAAGLAWWTMSDGTRSAAKGTPSAPNRRASRIHM